MKAILVLGMVLLGALPAAAGTAPNRLLILFARNPNDARLAQQTDMIAQAENGMAERDLQVREAIGTGDKAAALRHKYEVTAGFRVLLIGKDGHVAASSDQPIPSQQLFATIDAMPMRQDEMRRRGR